MNYVPDDSFVLDKCKIFADILRSRYGASGRGLGELTNSVADGLPINMVLALRRLAEIRNKVIKDRKSFPVSVYKDEVDRRYFEQLCAEVEQRLVKPISFSIINKRSGKCFDVSSWGTGNGESINQWDCHGGANQQWYFRRADDRHLQIISVHSNKCIDVPCASFDDLTHVHQWDCHGGDHQLWELAELEDGSYRITAKHSQRCLEVMYASYDNGSAITQYPWHGGDNQRWWLKVVLSSL